METASLSNIRKELRNLPPEELQAIILRLSKHKKENKELVSYMLFDAYNEQEFVENVKAEIDGQFSNINKSSFYLAKKTIRKVLRNTNKYIRFSGSKETEVQLLIHFCKKLKQSVSNYKSSRVVFNIYINQIKRINKALSALHEDLQYDYRDDIEKL